MLLRREDDATDVCDPNDKMTLIGRTCHSYVRRVMRQQARSIPKAIVLKSVIQSKRQLIQSFYDTVGGNDDEALTMMLSEDPATMKKREKLGKQLELLSAAFDEVAAAGFA